MKIKSLIVIAVLAIAVFAFGTANQTKAAANCLSLETTEQQTSCLQQVIADLMAQIQALQAQLGSSSSGSTSTTTTSPTAWCHTFGVNLGYAQSGSPEIGELKQALIKNGVMPYEAIDNTYDEDLMGSVVKFQQKYDISATGYFGTKTRAKMNSLYACGGNVCTQDVKQCSDGSYVSRSGPNCEFAPCPIECKADDDCPKLGMPCTSTYCPENKCITNKCQIVYSEPTTRCNATQQCVVGGEGKLCLTDADCSLATEITKLSKTSVMPGDSVTIYGRNLEKVSQVTLYNVLDRNIAIPLNPVTINQDGTDVTFVIPKMDATNIVKYAVVVWNQGSQVSSNELYLTIGGSVKPSITIVSPNGGEQLTTGQVYEINWRTTNISSTEKVRISLFFNHNDPTWKSGNRFEDYIAAETLNTGSYKWKIPEFYGTGLQPSSFQVKISSNGIEDFSDTTFTIKMGTSMPSLYFLKGPIAGETYKPEDKVTIQWIPQYKLYAYGMNLLKKGDPTFIRWLTLYPDYSNPGIFTWTVPGGLTGEDFYLRIQQSNDGTRENIGYSEVFKIKDSVTSSITVTNPVGGEILTMNSKVVDSLSSVDSQKQIFEIKWTGALDTSEAVYGNRDALPRINAYLEQKVGEQYNVIGHIIPEAYGSIYWVIGLVSDTNCQVYGIGTPFVDCYKSQRLVAPGTYNIKVVDSQTGAFGRSNKFTLIKQGVSILRISAAGDPDNQIRAGQKFTISGWNFYAPNEVYVGSKKATIVQEGTYQPDGTSVIIAVAPSDILNGDAYVTVKNVNGTSNQQLVTTVGSSSTVCETDRDCPTMCPSCPVGLGTTCGSCIIQKCVDRKCVPQNQSAVTVISPNGGETFTFGSQIPISWNDTTKAGAVGIWLLDTNKSMIGVIGQGKPSATISNSFLWDGKTVCQSFTGYVGSNCRSIYPGSYIIRVLSNSGDANGRNLTDDSDSYFKIVEQTGQLTIPELLTQITNLNAQAKDLITKDSLQAQLVLLQQNLILDNLKSQLTGTLNPPGDILTQITNLNAQARDLIVKKDTLQAQLVLLQQGLLIDKLKAQLLKPSVKVLSPNGGEAWQIGQTYTINYAVKNFNPADTIYIYLQKGYDDGSTKTGINSSMLIGQTTNTESFKYTVPSSISSWPGVGKNYTIRVCTTGYCQQGVSAEIGSDDSDGYFSITSATQAGLKVIFPSGGETLIAGRPYDINWSAVGYDKVDLELWDTATNRITTIASSVPTTGTFERYSWTPKTAGTYKINIIYRYSSGSGISASSNSYFKVVPETTQSSITVISPNGGENLQIGKTYDITWTATSNIDKVSIIWIGYDASGNITNSMNITPLTGGYGSMSACDQSGTDYGIPAGTGRFSWTIPQCLSGNIARSKVRVISRTNNISTSEISDLSDNYFTISATSPQQSIIVTSPSAGTYAVGATTNISWIPQNLPSNALVSIGLNGVTSTMVGAQIASNVLASSGSYAWTVPSFLGESLAGKTYNVYVTCTNCSTQVGGVGAAFTVAASAYNLPTITSISTSSASVGSQVTIYGTNLGATTTVILYPPSHNGGINVCSSSSCTGSAGGTTLTFTVPQNVVAGTTYSVAVVIQDSPVSSNEVSLTISSASVTVCTEFIYGSWGACKANTATDTKGTQTRVILGQLPLNCSGGNPVLTQSCTISTACTDTDGGKTYGTAGYITAGTVKGEDHCTADGMYLYEYFCTTETSDGRGYDYVSYQCPNGCANGACKATVSQNTSASGLASVSDALNKLLLQVQNFINGVK